MSVLQLEVVEPGAVLMWIFGSILALLWLLFVCYGESGLALALCSLRWGSLACNKGVMSAASNAHSTWYVLAAAAIMRILI